MHRISTDSDYLKTGQVIIDADGIPVDVPDRAQMDAADMALGQRIDAEKWRRGNLAAGASVDTLVGSASTGVWSVVSSAPGLPKATPGWVEVVYDPDSGRTKQTFTASTELDRAEHVRTWAGGAWTSWERVTVSPKELDDRISDEKWARPGLASGDTVDDKRGQAAQGLYPVNGAVSGLPKATPGWVEVAYDPDSSRTKQRFLPSTNLDNVEHIRTWTGSAWTAWSKITLTTGDIDSRVTAAKWGRGNLATGTSADTLFGSASAGLWTVGASAAGLPRSGPGWVEVTHDGYSGRTKQTFTASTELDDTIYTRTYAGGKWTPWVGSSIKGIPVSTGSADSLRAPGDYYIANSSVTGTPVAAQGPFEVLSVNSTSGLVQRFTAATAGNSVWVRSTTGTEWDAWERLGGASARDRPITYRPEIITKSGGEILYAMSHDRTYGYNSLTHSLKITYDHGRTWKEVYLFGGQQMESTHILDNGELLITTNRGGWREVYVSTGLPANPEEPVFTKVLDPAAYRVKFAAGWSISVHKNMVLLNEYGPKGGMEWDDIAEVPEGENARYTYLSLDYGKTWKTIFDLNEYLLAEGQADTLRRHLHGVAWDPYWDRIWVSFGDNMSGNGSNGVVYSDDLGKTWHTAHHTSSTGQTWQVTSILPMPDKLYMGGDIYPSGFMSVDREGGKHRTTWNFDVAYQHPTGMHLCQAVQRVTLHSGETVGLAAFSSEGAVAKSFILGVREHGDIQLVWEDTIAQQSGMGLRYICGPTLEGELIAAHNDLRVHGTYSELRGPIDLY